MRLNSLMIRASAGSGKTFQLSNRFLALLAAGAEPSSVIALTFTRKAAGEFADRILSRLAKGALDEASAVALAKEIGETLAGNASTKMPGLFAGEKQVPLDLGRFQELLEGLVANLHRVALSTLDSFFVRIAKRFPYELGLSRMDLLEADQLDAEKKQILGRIFREVSESQKEAFLWAFKHATHGKEEVRLSKLLGGFLDDHHERYLGARDLNRWGNVEDLWANGCPWPEVKDFAAAASAVKGLLNTVRMENGKPDARWQTGWEKALEWFAAYEPGDGRDLPSAIERGLKLLPDLARGAAADVFYRKEHWLEGRLAKAMTDLLGGYLRAEIEIRGKRTQGIAGLLFAYETLYESGVRRRGRLGFADVTRLLADGGLTDRIGERLDATYQQWLLDEFQDTSRLQWAVLEGLADEAVTDAAGERSLFVVGDTKQGIYGWRGGEPRLFDDLLVRPGWSERLIECGMETSWRSSQEVLDLANLVCDPSGESMTSRFPKAALERWKFAEHRAAKRDASLAGYTVVIDTGAEETEDGELSGIESALCDLMAETQPVERGLSCAILVRSNKQARVLVDLLRKEFPGMPVEMDAEIELANDNPLGVALLDLFRWLAHPSDDYALGHVEHSPLRCVLESFGETPAHGWHACREKVTRDGMAGLLAELSAGLRRSGALNGFLEERLEGITRAAFDYDESGDRDFDSWIARLEKLKQREHSSSGAVQVMTLHKAKGLEFDLVVLPDLGGGAFDDPSKAGMLEFKDAAGRIEVMLLPPKKALLEADPELKERFETWAADQCYERFCNLYVALTRAKHATYVLLPKAPKTASSQRRFDLWLRDAVGDEEGKVNWAGNEWHALAQRGDAGWFKRSAQLALHDETPAESIVLGEAVPRRQRTTPSGAKAAGSILHSPDGMRFGRAVHVAFERVGWLDEEAPVLPQSEAGDLVRSLIGMPELRPLFERRGRNVELLREQPVEAILDGKWLSGVLDRLHVIRDGGGEIVALEAIDFKTDAVENAEELAKRYTGQMNAYRRTLREAFGVETVECLLVSTRDRILVRV
jgi:ATP-dependent exoDNAse (exonuclease V) beta subunit